MPLSERLNTTVFYVMPNKFTIKKGISFSEIAYMNKYINYVITAFLK